MNVLFRGVTREDIITKQAVIYVSVEDVNGEAWTFSDSIKEKSDQFLKIEDVLKQTTNQK